MLNGVFSDWYAEYHYAECRYAECRYVECRYAKCRYADCHGTFTTAGQNKIYLKFGIQGSSK